MKKIFAVIICLVIVFTMASCGSSQGDPNIGSTEKNSDTVLTVSEEDADTGAYYSLDALKKIGTEKVTYSGRNKKTGNERAKETYTGVDLKKLLEDAGFKKYETVKVSCSDGYTREYEIEKLYDLYYFKNSTASKGEKVSPMLAIVKKGTRLGNNKDFDPNDGTPLRLVYGQEKYDRRETKDYNMQGWAGYVDKIEVINK